MFVLGVVHLGHVGREQPGVVVDPVVVVGLQQVVDEREVARGDRRPVGPLPWLQHDVITESLSNQVSELYRLSFGLTTDFPPSPM